MRLELTAVGSRPLPAVLRLPIERGQTDADRAANERGTQSFKEKRYAEARDQVAQAVNLHPTRSPGRRR